MSGRCPARLARLLVPFSRLATVSPAQLASVVSDSAVRGVGIPARPARTRTAGGVTGLGLWVRSLVLLPRLLLHSTLLGPRLFSAQSVPFLQAGSRLAGLTASCPSPGHRDPSLHVS